MGQADRKQIGKTKVTWIMMTPIEKKKTREGVGKLAEWKGKQGNVSMLECSEKHVSELIGQVVQNLRLKNLLDRYH